MRGGGQLPLVVIPTLTAATYSLLLLRWRRPTDIFAVQWAYSLVGLLVPGYQPVAGLLVALHAVACRTSIRHAAAALLVCSVPYGIGSWQGASGRVNLDTSFAFSFAVQFFLYAVLTTAIWCLGRVSHATDKRNVHALEEQAAEAARTVAAERLQLARDLHDILASAVTAMLLQAAGARALLGTSDARVGDALQVIEDAGVEAMRELQRLLTLLRSVDETNSEGHSPGLENLDDLVDRARASGVAVDTTTHGDPKALDRSVDLAAYRVVQEALTNVTKHGGRSPSARLSLQWRPEHLLISVDSVNGVDDGLHLALPSGHGLRGLTERVELIGGLLHAAPTNAGYRIHVKLPVAANTMSQPAATSERQNP